MRALLVGLCALVPTLTLALPNHVVQEGLVLDANGLAVEGRHDLTVRLYADLAGGAALYEEVHRGVDFFEGYYVIAIGSVEALPDGIFRRPSLYLSVQIDQGAELAPRTELRKVPAAFVADVAFDVVGDITPRTVSVGGRVVINSDGEWVGPRAGLVGPAGPAGPEGPEGPAGPAGGDGSPDTPQQVRDKLVQVDGAGSGVDADRFDGLDSTAFAKTPAEVRDRLLRADGAGSGVDADRLDGLDSTVFVRTAAQVLALLRSVDGAGSGVDADRLDGIDSGAFLRTAAQVLAILAPADGAGSGLDSDRLDGLDSTQFLRIGQDGIVADLQVRGDLQVVGGFTAPLAGAEPGGCNAGLRGRIYFNTANNQFWGCNGQAWVRLDAVGGGGGGGKQIVIVNGARQWSDGTAARSCLAYRQDNAFINPVDGLYRLNTGRATFSAYCDMNTDGGGWVVVGHYRHPGNQNAPGGHDNRDYALYMKAQTSATYGNAAYIGDPNSAGPWTDWRPLDGVGWPVEFAVLLDQNFFASRWENWGRKAIYRVKSRSIMPNHGTTQNLRSGDNLQYKLNVNDNWSDVGTDSASGIYYWYPRAANNNYLTLFHVSNYRYIDGRAPTNYHHSNYWGRGMGGNDSWHHGSRLLVRELAPPVDPNSKHIALGADGVRTWSNGDLSATCKQYRRPPAGGGSYAGDIGDGRYRLRTPAGILVAYCDMSTDGGGWTMVGHYRHPGNSNAPGDHDNRDYAYYMRARNNAAYGNAAYLGNPDSPGPWTDWRILSATSFPLEYAVILDRGTPFLTGWDNGRDVIYRVKNRNIMPNHSTNQDLTSGDNLYYKLSPGANWTDVGGSSASGIYYWYPRASNNTYLTLFHVSNYRYIDGRRATNYHYNNYWGRGMGGDDSWHHGSHQFVREL